MGRILADMRLTKVIVYIRFLRYLEDTNPESSTHPPLILIYMVEVLNDLKNQRYILVVIV